MELSRRRFLMVALSGATLAACGGTPQAASPAASVARPSTAIPAAASPPASGGAAASLIKMKAAYGQPTMINAPVWVAAEKGLFKKYGLDVELTQILGSNITQAIVGHSVDMISSTASSTFLANMEGGDTLLVGSSLNVITNDIIANPKKIQVPQDVKGKNAAINKGGDFGETALFIALKDWGLNRGDVNYVVGFSTDAARMAAIVNGAADFSSIDIGARPEYENACMKRLTTLLDAKTHFVMSGLFTSKAFANSRPQAVEGYLKAITEALYVLHHDKASTVQFAAKYMRTDPKDVEPAYGLIEPHQNKIPTFTLQDVKDSLQGLDNATPKAKNANPNDFYSLAYLDNLQKSGFFQQIWGSEI
jgi:NitT/TauT family transport system substrate-binding protein